MCRTVRARIQGTVIAESIHDLPDGFFCIKAVIVIAVPNSTVDCLLAGQIRLVGAAVSVQLPMLAGISSRLGIDW